MIRDASNIASVNSGPHMQTAAACEPRKCQSDMPAPMARTQSMLRTNQPRFSAILRLAAGRYPLKKFQNLSLNEFLGHCAKIRLSLAASLGTALRHNVDPRRRLVSDKSD